MKVTKNCEGSMGGRALCAILLAVFFGMPAMATLGGSASSVNQDANSIKADSHKIFTQKFTSVHELTRTGLTVKEFVSPSGLVYGIAWRGVTHPDLTALMGRYFSDYALAEKNTPRTHGRGLRRVTGSGVVVETSGHMMDVRGKAYIPELLPAGVTAQDIQW